MKRIYLVRHCKAYGQASDAALTDEGLIQASALAEFFSDKKVEKIVTSPFERAKATIRPYSIQMDIEMHTEPRLRERVLSAEPLSDWLTVLKASFTDMDQRFPGGESSREAMNRGIAVINELLDSPEENLIAVTHGNLLSLMLKHYDAGFGFDEWRRLTNPDVYELSVAEAGGEITVSRIWES